MANEENLIPADKRSKEELVENGRKGGIKSGITRRKKRDMRESMQMILDLGITQNQIDQLKNQGIDAAGWTLTDVVNISAVQAAMSGSVSAMQYCRDTAGYSPELQLREQMFQFEKEQKTGQGVEIEDLSTVITDIWGYDTWMKLLNDGIPVLLTKQMIYKFTKKHIEYIRKCQDCTYNILEGAIRAGKTVDNVLAFALEICRSEDKFFLASGSTMANAKLNIGTANGFGLENIFRGQCRWGKFRDNDSLIIRGPYTNYEEKVVIFAGGESSVSFRKIRGNSYGMWIATEINLHHDSFIQEAFNRTAAAKKRKFFWDLNPCHPSDPIYQKYIDVYEQKDREGTLKGGFNFDQFTIFDNCNISKERLDEITSQYDPDSIWYKRDIEGKRSIAEGLVYNQLATSITIKDGKYTISKEQAREMVNNGVITQIHIGIDFGGNGSGHAFVASADTVGYDKLILLRSERYVEGEKDSITGKKLRQMDPEILSSLFIRFVKQIIADYGYVTRCYADSAEQVLIRGLRSALVDEDLGNIKVVDAKKMKITDRIFTLTSLVAGDRFYYVDGDCSSFESAASMAVWNPKKIELERLDDGSSDIDTLDAFEYTFERNMKKYIKQTRE